MNEQDEAFQEAIQAHQLALAVYGDAHPKTTEAMLAVMLLERMQAGMVAERTLQVMRGGPNPLLPN